ncbi:MAG TPA: aminotransferase class V-fold PLP-dependent enzyme [Acidobacteriota bacterium]|nr:aminotransferase class V-fold PLP-dependent enzyme [Acidobacteriota bacterium]
MKLDAAAVKLLRDDTPGTRQRLHFDNAGAGLMPRPVIDAIHRHIDLEAETGGYQAGHLRAEQIEQARADVASLIGAQARNVAFTENATAAFAQALSSIEFHPGDVILTCADDYVSNQIQYLSLASRLGLEVDRARSLPGGGLDLEDFELHLRRRRPRLVALHHVPTNSGVVQPVEEVGRLCRELDVLFLLDACQSVGQLPLDVTRLHCDFLSATSRKFLRGPRGCGFLYASDQVLKDGYHPLFIDLHGGRWIDEDVFRPVDDARRFENWEFAYALVLATGEAARYAQKVGLEAIAERNDHLAQSLREELVHLPRVNVMDLQAPRLAATVMIELPFAEGPEALQEALFQRGINVSMSYREYARVEFRAESDWVLRASPHYYNIGEEVGRFVAAIGDLLSK